jgi:hypothetical protein
LPPWPVGGHPKSSKSQAERGIVVSAGVIPVAHNRAKRRKTSLWQLDQTGRLSGSPPLSISAPELHAFRQLHIFRDNLILPSISKKRELTEF